MTPRFTAADYLALCRPIADRAPRTEVDRFRALDERRARLERIEHVVGVDADTRNRIAQGSLFDTKPRRTVYDWNRSGVPMCVLLGSSGIGKTVSGAELIADRGGYFITARDLERVFSAKYGPLLREQETLIRAPVLVVDDCGTEDSLPAMLGVLCEIADKRLIGRRTLITANGTVDHFRKRYADPRLLDRLAQHAVMAMLTAPSLRRSQVALPIEPRGPRP